MSTLVNPVGWFEIHVADMDRAKTFYESVFNRTLIEIPAPEASMRMMMFAGDTNSSGAAGALVKHPIRQPTKEGALVYFSCKDCTSEVALAVQHGGKVFKDKFNIGANGFIAIIGDCEGNAIGLHSFQ